MVKVYGVQSVSMTPASGAMACSPRLGSKQAGNVKRQGAMAEVAADRRPRRPARLNANGVESSAAGPDCDKRRRTENFPSECVGNVERQATIREALVGRFHPFALDRCRSDIHIMTVDHVGCKLHCLTMRMSGCFD